MKIERKSDHAVGDESCKAATGKTLAEWFNLIDRKGGASLGRREIGTWMAAELKVEPWWATTINNEYEVARGVVEKDGKPKGYTICATKSIKADADSCFAAFNGNAALDRWFGKGHDVNLSDGGHWRNADGNRARIKKVNAGKNIRLIWEDEALTMPAPIEIKFAPSGAKCTVMVTIDRLQTRAEADGYRQAWGQALDRLKAQLEA